MSRRATKRTGPRQAKKPPATDALREASAHDEIVPAQAQRSVPSGVFDDASQSTPERDELIESMVKLRPYYRESERASERAAELELEDLSLRPDNPYAASPLIPPLILPPELPSPARSARSLSTIVLGFVSVAAVSAAAGSGAWFYWDRAMGSGIGHACPPTPSCKCETTAALAFGAESSAAMSLAPRVPEPTAEPQPEARVVAPIHDSPPVTAVVEPAGNPLQDQPSTRKPRRTQQAREAAVAPAPQPPPPVPEPQPAPEEIVPPTLPRLPTPSQIKLAFRKIQAPLSECAGGKHGVLMIHATITHEGRIASASVDSVFQKPEERACMARAILSTQFPPFKQDTFSVSYPLVL